MVVSKPTIQLFRDINPLIEKAFERGRDGIKPPAPEIEQWIDAFVAKNDSLQLCLSATRFLFRVKSVVSNFDELHSHAKALCERDGYVYTDLFKGVTEYDHFRPWWK